MQLDCRGPGTAGDSPFTYIVIDLSEAILCDCNIIAQRLVTRGWTSAWQLWSDGLR